MSDVFVLGYDGTDSSQRAADYAGARAKAEGATVHVVYVLEWSAYSFLTPEELEERHKRRGEEISRGEEAIAPVSERLKKDGVKVTSEVRHGSAAEILIEISKKQNARQIVVGRTGSSALAERILGGLTLSLVQAAPVPVTVVP